MQLSILGVNQYHEVMSGLREFGDLIKSARIKRGMTGVDLAQKMGRSHSVIVRWERGQPSNPPDPETFWDFSKALGVPPEDMLRALGYLMPDEDAVVEAPAVSAIRAILEGRDFTDDEVAHLATMVRTMVSAMKG